MARMEAVIDPLSKPDLVVSNTRGAEGFTVMHKNSGDYDDDDVDVSDTLLILLMMMIL